MIGPDESLMIDFTIHLRGKESVVNQQSLLLFLSPVFLLLLSPLSLSPPKEKNIPKELELDFRLPT